MFLRPGKNLERNTLYFRKYKKIDRNNTLFLLYTVRNLFLSIAQNKTRFVPKLSTGILEKIHIF